MLQTQTSFTGKLVGRLLAPAKRRSHAERYGASIAIPLLALVITIALADTSHIPFFPLFTLAGALSSVFGGMWPGLVTVVVSTILNLFLAPPYWSTGVASLENGMRLGLFASAGCAIAVLVGAASELQSDLQLQHSELLITLRSIGDAVIATL